MARVSRLNPQLVVWHRAAGPGAVVRSATGFAVATCQRLFSVGGVPEDTCGFKRYTGEAAYRLLLEIATGLRSDLPGETNVFGQIKRAWREQRGRLADEYGEWIQQWFTDTKAVRAQHLQGVGGQSYAGLCRQLLTLPPEAPLAVVGGGALAASMVSSFRRHPRTLFVRTQPRFAVDASISVEPLDRLPAQLTNSAAVIVCTPPNTGWELRVLPALRSDPTPLIHLGYRETKGSPLEPLQNYYGLDTLFTLEQQRANLRSIKLAAAKRACVLRARDVFATIQRNAAPMAHAQ